MTHPYTPPGRGSMEFIFCLTGFELHCPVYILNNFSLRGFFHLKIYYFCS
jgi:hypothetical protein